MTLRPLAVALTVVIGVSAPVMAEPTSIVIDAALDSAGTYYKIASSAPIVKIDGELDGHVVTLNEDDVVSGNIAVGYVKFGKDGYRTDGQILSIEMENPGAATFYINGEAFETAPAAAAPEEVDTQANVPTRRRPGDRLRRPGVSAPAAQEAQIGETEKNDAPPELTAVTLKPKPVPLVIVDTRNGEAGDKSDKGNEVTETTPTLKFKTGDALLSDVSGRRGDESLSFEFGNRPMNAISWSETSDKVCQISLVSQLEDQTLAWRQLQKCGGGTFACERETCTTEKFHQRNQTNDEDDEDIVLTVDGDFNVTIHGQQTAITALSVCTNGKSNGRVKGIEITGAELLPSGQLGSRFDTDRHALAHCRDWEPRVLCPSGSVATGLRAHFDAGSGLGRNVSQLVGLQMMCRAVAID